MTPLQGPGGREPATPWGKWEWVPFCRGKRIKPGLKKSKRQKRPGPRFEPGSEDPQSSRITNYPTLANSLLHWQWSLFKVSFWKVASTHDAG